MFRCQICGQIAPAGTRSSKVVLVSRPKNYVSRGGQDGFPRRFRGQKVKRREYDRGGKGHEIVREVVACEGCAKQVKPVMEEAESPESDTDAGETAATTDAPHADDQPTESE